MANFVIFFDEKYNGEVIGEMQLSVVAKSEAEAINKYIETIGYLPKFDFLEVKQID